MSSASAVSSVLARVRASRLFRSGRPPHAFVLTRDRLVWVGAASEKGGVRALRGLSRPLPDGALRPGPGGAPVAGEGLARTVAAVVAAAGVKIAAASLVVPDGFVRTTVLDLPETAPQDREVEEMASWKAARAWGDPPPEVRLAWQPVGPSPAGGARILAAASPTEAVDSWEDAFASAGVRIGALEPAALAAWWVARHAVGPDGFYVWADGETATAAFLRGGELRFLRSRPAFDPVDALHEIRLSAAFASAGAGSAPEDAPGGAGMSGACAAGPEGNPVVEYLRRARSEAGASEPVPLSRERLLPEMTVTGLAPDDPAVFLALSVAAAAG